MKKFQKHMIVSDMDGTFFGENAVLLQKNLDAIAYFRENGGIFTFATGRDFKVLGLFHPKLYEVVSCPGILCNGSYLYNFHSNTLSNEFSLDKDEMLYAIDVIKKEIPEASFRISSPLGFLCSSDNPLPFHENQVPSFEPILIVDDVKKYRNIPWHKLVYSTAGEKSGISDERVPLENSWIHKVKKISKQFDFKNTDMTTSASTLLEFMPKGASKGRALKKLKEMYPDRAAICVGDYQNDIDMLLAADIPACPDNALDKVKSISKIHLCHHRDGCIADLIYKLDSSIKE